MSDEIQDHIEKQRDPGHIELHIVPMHDETRVRVIMATGGKIGDDQPISKTDLPAHLSRLMAKAAIGQVASSFLGRLGLGGP